MKSLALIDSKYRTAPRPVGFLSKKIPSMIFYMNLFWIICRSSFQAKHGKYDDEKWSQSSLDVLTCLEKVGMRFDFTGMENFSDFDDPCIFIGNHMSMMETLVLPILIRPKMKLTFVIKESLLHYPIFKHVMRSRNPISVTRTKPRADLKTVLIEGKKRLEENTSIIVFPQTTRAHVFDPEQFSTIGVKLAKKGKVKIVPFAVKTDAWENGRVLKDFGRLNAEKIVHISFGTPLQVEGKGILEHDEITRFIEEKLRRWGADTKDSENLT